MALILHGVTLSVDNNLSERALFCVYARVCKQEKFTRTCTWKGHSHENVYLNKINKNSSGKLEVFLPRVRLPPSIRVMQGMVPSLYSQNYSVTELINN